MRLLLVENLVCVPAHGGANKANQVVVEGLVQHGHECLIIARSTSAQGSSDHAQFLRLLEQRGLTVEVASAGVDVFCQGGVRYYAVADVGRMRGVLIEQIHSFQPDLVLVSSEDSGQTLLEAALQAAPDRVVYLAHTPQMFPFGSDSFVPSAAGTALVRQVAGIIADGARTATLVEQYTGIAPVVIHPPVYGQPPFPNYGATGDYVTLINPSGVKGLPIFAGLAARLPTVPFAALPGWSTTAADRQQLAELPNVAIWPPTPEIDQLLAHTRVLLVPSLYQEGFGIVTVEAMLRGIPVLASDYGGLVDAKLGVDYCLPIRPIERYEARFDDRGYPLAVLPPQDLAPWEAALRALLADPQHYAQVSRESRAAAAAFIDGLGIAPFAAFLRDLVDRRTTPRAAAATPQADPSRWERLQTLSPTQRALLAQRARARQSSVQQAHAIPQLPRSPQGNRFVASASQRQLWFLSELQPESTAYNDPVALTLRGTLDLTALTAALDALLTRQESLRSTFALEQGQLMQVVAAAQTLQIEIHDLRAQPAQQRQGAAAAIAAASAARPFDLSSGRLFRVSLLRLADDHHMLLLILHHIVSDGWSWAVLLADLAALYRQQLAHPDAGQLAPLPIQYADYAAWQRARLRGALGASQRAYWQQQLADLPTLDLPTDHPRPALLSSAGATAAYQLPAELSAQLAALSQREGVTLFMTLVTAWLVVLARWSGQRDLAIGTPIANRTRSEIAGLVGFFANTLVLRTQLEEPASLRAVLQHVGAVARGAYANQDLPFEEVVDAVNQPRDLSRHPLFQLMVMYQAEPLVPPTLPGLTTALLPVANATSKFDLTLTLEARPAGLGLVFEYCTALFEAATVAQLAQHLQQVLGGMVADLNQRWTHLPLLSAAERGALRPRASLPVHTPQCIHTRVAAQAARTPAATALVCGDQRLSYGELDLRANQLAHLLIAHGVGPETRVAICLERSIELVVAILGVLKAGGAYVPIDPAYPVGRVQFILDDAQPAVLITSAHHDDAMPGGREQRTSLAAGPWVLIDPIAATAALALQPTSAPHSPVQPDNLAYVIYTSGSTGRPKGSLVSHANVDRLFQATQPWFDFSERDVWTLFHSAAFDFSVWELWGALCYGGRLVVVPYWVSRTPDACYALLLQEGVTVLNQTPSAFQQLIAVDQGHPQASQLALRLVIFGGEALHLPSLLPWVARHGDQQPQLVNMYGITETTVHVTYRPLRHADLVGGSGSMIGVAIPDLEIYLLDRYGQPVPRGVVGELYVGGAGLARGYLNRPDLTATRFVPHPLSDRPGARLYRSGDLARQRHTGDLEYLGRSDTQVKLRGFRIELGEIKALLLQCAHVRDAEVLLRAGPHDHSADKRLVAYIVPTPGSAPSAVELRSALQAQLPAYMLPSAFVLLDRLPLTVNGKLDVQALPAPQHDRAALAEEDAPSSAAERVIAQLWAELLGLVQVGLYDNFFEVGGNSLLATQLINRLHDVFQVKVALRSFFLSPTVVGLRDELTALWGDRAVVEEIAATFRDIADMSADAIGALLADGPTT